MSCGVLTSSYFLRYLAICHPLFLSSHSKSARAFCVIGLIWTFGISYSIPWVIPTKVTVQYVSVPEEALHAFSPVQTDTAFAQIARA